MQNTIFGCINAAAAGGCFDFYLLGEAFFKDDGNLNEKVGKEKNSQQYFLKKYIDTGYYFNYDAERITTLNHDFLSTIKTKAMQYVIFASNWLLTKNLW